MEEGEEGTPSPPSRPGWPCTSVIVIDQPAHLRPSAPPRLCCTRPCVPASLGAEPAQHQEKIKPYRVKIGLRLGMASRQRRTDLVHKEAVPLSFVRKILPLCQTIISPIPLPTFNQRKWVVSRQPSRQPLQSLQQRTNSPPLFPLLGSQSSLPAYTAS